MKESFPIFFMYLEKTRCDDRITSLINFISLDQVSQISWKYNVRGSLGPGLTIKEITEKFIETVKSKKR